MYAFVFLLVSNVLRECIHLTRQHYPCPSSPLAPRLSALTPRPSPPPSLSIGQGAATWWISDDDTHEQQEPFLAYMLQIANTTDTPHVHSIR